MIKTLRLAQGFTLVEIIVVMAVMGIFLVVGTTTYTNQVHEKELKTDADRIVNEIEKARQDVLARNVFGYTACNHNGISLYGYSLPNSTYNIVLHCVTTWHNIREGTLEHSYIARTEPFLQIYFPYPYGVLMNNELVTIHHNTTNRCININTGPYTPATASDPYDCT
ncbi:type II secretion system protein [Candidatus Roizmanbacteria bacterium]|nr:MAG: type II secretion system protein [Candidatus Roizmanbacteria bacterium]